MEHQVIQALPHPVQSSVPGRELYTVDEFVLLPEFGYLKKASLRHMIFESRPRFSAGGDVIPGNGLIEAGAIVRLGRRVLINAPRFREWVLSQQKEASAP